MIKFNNLVEAIHDATIIANNKMIKNHNALVEDYFTKGADDKLTAKNVIVNYPIATESGETKIIEVSVPLITLVPISSAQVESLKFSTDLEIALDKGELLVSFAKKNEQQEGWFDNKSKSTAKIELTVKPSDASEGLKKLIEGYEKILRAQIPG